MNGCLLLILVNDPRFTVGGELALAAIEFAVEGDSHLVSLSTGIGELGGANPWVCLTQLGVGDTLLLCPTDPTCNRRGNLYGLVVDRLVELFFAQTVAISFGILKDHLEGDDAEDISRSL